MADGMCPPSTSLDAFFNPNRIAVIGASASETKIGGRPIRNLKLGGFKGEIVPINPGRDEVQGLKAFASLGAFALPVDLAIVAVPASQVLEQVRACVASGVRAATIFSAGFAETDAAGAALQAEVTAVARAGGLRLLGPNCMGTINSHGGVLATFTSGIVDSPPPAGRISIASQSGAFGAHCLTLMRERGLGVSLWATTGNQSDVEVADFLAYMAEDPGTDVIIGSIEGINNASTLVRAFETAHRLRKPMIMMKVGRSQIGADAMASHTASLAGSDAVFDAVLRQHGVQRAHTIDELLDLAYACSLGRLPANRQLGVVTLSGGVGVLIADAADDVGLDVAPLSVEVQERMRALVPFAATRNPLDVTAQFLNDPDLIEPMFAMLMSEGGYGSVITFLSHLGMNPHVIGSLMPGLERVATLYPNHYLTVSVIASPEVRARLEKMGYAVFEDPTRAIRTHAALASFAEAFDRKRPVVAPMSGTPLVELGRVYNEFEAKALLRAAGLPAPVEEVARTRDLAAQAADRIGYPVVLKIVSPDIPHKSDIGAVLLNLGDAESVRSGFDIIQERVKAAAPDARAEGVLVAPMIGKGVETVIGLFRDPVFGPMVMFGLGGVFVEILKDVVFRPAPFGVDEARLMIAEVRGAALLDGARGAAPADKEALAKALSDLSLFAAANADTIASVDINPVVVLEAGKGVMALDALINAVPLGGAAA